jgi:hypothetical protein
MSAQIGLIEAHEQTIGKIFSDGYAFEIPPYQRPYAWEKEQASELLTDLLEAMDDTGVSGGVYRSAALGPSSIRAHPYIR